VGTRSWWLQTSWLRSFSAVVALANFNTSLQQHRDRIRNSNQCDRHTITHCNGKTQQASRLLTLGTAATLITSSRATPHVETKIEVFLSGTGQTTHLFPTYIFGLHEIISEAVFASCGNIHTTFNAFKFFFQKLFYCHNPYGSWCFQIMEFCMK